MEKVSSHAKAIAAEEFSDPTEPKHQLGPDYIIPANEYRTWDREGSVHLLNVDKNDEYLLPESVVTFFHKTVVAYPNNPALTVKRNGLVSTWNYLEYWNDVRTAAKGFIKLGLRPLHGVCVLGFNSPEWMMSSLAAIFAGGFCAGIYTTNSPEACFHVLNDCLANVVVVENDVQLQKILKVRSKLPHLKAIVQYTGEPTDPDVLSWNDLMHIGNSVPEEILERRIKGVAINQCCCIIYTSGSTGNSKGVMMSHDNILVMSKFSCRDVIKFKKFSTIISYLPLSHIAALAGDIYVPILVAGQVHFAPPEALKGKLIDTLREVKPTGLVAVPRVFEKIYEKMQEAELLMSAPKKNLYKWARKQALNRYTKSANLSAYDRFLFAVAKKLVLDKIHLAFGLQNVNVMLCGAAPIPVEVLLFFYSLDLLVVSGYGLSESSGLHIANKVNQYRFGSVGKPDPRKMLEVKLGPPDETGATEVLLKGRNIFMGYINLEDKTLEALGDDHWLHTGDFGKFDEDGFLFITGRKKELIITSGGENVPPVVIEDIIKKLIPAVSHCVLIGDKRKYLSMLITFKTELHSETIQPHDQLTQPVIKWCRSAGSDVSSVSEILKTKDEAVFAAVQREIDVYNKNHAVSHAQRIQKWRILAHDFSVHTGELGPTAKLRRPFILQKYSNVIEQMYDDSKI